MSAEGQDQGNDSDSSGRLEDTRPNRWAGLPSTWQSLTFQERGLITSLNQIRNADLSVHLYNAHALKKRASETHVENMLGGKLNGPYSMIPEADRVFRPPKNWTAWPLPPDEVPREGETIGPTDPDDIFTLKRPERVTPSRVLEDILSGVTLKYAKEQFQSRISADEGDIRVEDVENFIGRPVLKTTEVVVGSEEDRNEDMKGWLKSIVSVDEERSREVLRPSIRHTLSKLDEALMALHHARETCHRYSRSESDAEETELVEDLPPPEKRPIGRPRKFANLPDRSRVDNPVQNVPLNYTDISRAKKSKRGRPMKEYERLGGETQQEYLIRIARIQKKPLPSFAPPLEPTQTPTIPLETSKRPPGKRATSQELYLSRQKKLSPRDWSEVLGSAALVRFSPNVIARATQRCADLFGEGMHMRTMVEMPLSEKYSDTSTRYEPQIVPPLSEGDGGGSTGDEGFASDESGWTRKPRNSKEDTSSSILNGFCPIPGCARKPRGFRNTSALKKHLLNGHNILEGDLDDYILPSEEEMDGAVHLDGFLRPLKKQNGSQSKYRKIGGEVDSQDDSLQSDATHPRMRTRSSSRALKVIELDEKGEA